MWSNLFRLGKQIKLQVSINYTEDSNCGFAKKRREKSCYVGDEADAR